ncbi:fumarylacetoacetate hydrolase family protein [Chengkuizengella sp. SCS-71B]|uniref:fumarylacetoacetate hydrolase family protein n=1 Tax=Chengkuizengella sp. SCS-71B TaxID=3115290 RepID=UPI0039B78F3F
MRYVTFLTETGDMRAGWLNGDKIIDMNIASDGKLPNDLLTFIDKYDTYYTLIENIQAHEESIHALENVTLCAPLPHPPSVRDFYAFEEHVKTARAKRGLTVIPEWYEMPVFYFTNHKAITGPEQSIEKPKNCSCLDFELELACVIGKKGKNITVDQAEKYILGYTIMNDWSARDIQAKEMKVGLGPAKGKDFATSIGPFIATSDELEQYKVGDRYQLEMTASVNGKPLSKGNFQSIYYSFAEMIERASQNVTLYPGDIIGSGTVGSGCILELGTDVHRWLEPGDVVELEITGLGVLRNKIVE